MAIETQPQPPHPYVEAWPPADTEESILGTELHQATITNVRWGINEIAKARTVPGEDPPWHALSQTAVLGCRRYDGSLFRTYPDVFVYARPIASHRGSVVIEVDGPPLLIIEVLSESTFESDIDSARGKGFSYVRAGVREYLTLDPTGAYVPEGIRAWRLEEGRYEPWQPLGDGRWHSTQIEVAIGLEGALAAVYTPRGRRMLREGEVEAELARREAELAQQEAALEGERQLRIRQQEEIERLHRLLADR